MPRNADRPDSYFSCFSRWVYGEGQALGGWWQRSWCYWWPREWPYLLKVLIIAFLLGASAVATFSVVSTSYGGIVHEAEHRVWQIALRAFAALHDQISIVSDDAQNWRQAMRYVIAVLVILGIFEHAVFLAMHVWEKLREHLEKTHPFWLWSAIMGSFLLILVGAVPETSNLGLELIT